MDFAFQSRSEAHAHSRDHHHWFHRGRSRQAYYPGGQSRAQGFILTTVLGIVGAFVATYLGQALGWYGPDQNAGFIGAIVGAVLILLVWGLIQKGRGTA
jgi:uncharacterized membrane protein YeaQ/YmgE (transglycosylase-associated protein family)